jgi:hypothetical protein
LSPIGVEFFSRLRQYAAPLVDPLERFSVRVIPPLLFARWGLTHPVPVRMPASQPSTPSRGSI